MKAPFWDPVQRPQTLEPPAPARHHGKVIRWATRLTPAQLEELAQRLGAVAGSPLRIRTALLAFIRCMP